MHGSVTHGSTMHGSVTHGSITHGSVTHGSITHGSTTMHHCYLNLFPPIVITWMGLTGLLTHYILISFNYVKSGNGTVTQNLWTYLKWPNFFLHFCLKKGEWKNREFKQFSNDNVTSCRSNKVWDWGEQNGNISRSSERTEQVIWQQQWRKNI